MIVLDVAGRIVDRDDWNPVLTQRNNDLFMNSSAHRIGPCCAAVLVFMRLTLNVHVSRVDSGYQTHLSEDAVCSCVSLICQMTLWSARS